MNIIYVNYSEERVMYRGLGVAAKSYLVFDHTQNPPYQQRPLTDGFPQKSVIVDDTDDYDSIIRVMTGSDSNG